MNLRPKRVFQPIPPDAERTGKVVLDAATALGPGLFESVYRTAMKHIIETKGLLAETEVKLPIMFEGLKLESGLRGSTADISSVEWRLSRISDQFQYVSFERWH